MASVELPIDPTMPDQKFYSQLEGELFNFRVRWNDRAGMWFLSIGDAAGTIVSGRGVILGASLLRRFTDRRLPKGDLIVIDTSGKNVDAGIDDLGTRVKIIYVDSASLPAWPV
jgi:hypothetical protein